MNPEKFVDWKHLTKRYWRAICVRSIADSDIQIARELLNDRAFAAWSQMPVSDQSHSLEVLARFEVLLPKASRAEKCGVLLHDIGKLKSGLGIFGRVCATIIGPRGNRFVQYHNHEAIGAEIVSEFGLDQVSIDLVGGISQSEALDALRAADAI